MLRSTLLLATLSLIGCGTSSEERTTTTKEEPAPAPADPIGELAAQLVGSWLDVQNQGDTRFYEQWKKDGENAYSGLGFVMSGADTVFIEELMLRNEGSGWIYSARISSQNEGGWVHFKERPAGDQAIMFVNAEHDFPQTIRYILDDDRWRVSVAGEQEGEPREESFLLAPRTDQPG